jgi:hypothetical protein
MNDYNSQIMKKVAILLLVILTMPLTRLMAQNTNLEKLNAYKIGFFTKRLNLTSQEAEKFWPVYNEYQAQKNLIQLEKVKLIRTFNQSETSLKDDQLSEIGDKLIGCITQESALSISLHKKLKEVLPPGKVIRFYQAENQYKAQLLNELQNTTPQQRQNLRRNLNQ